jgi:putative ABC transport system substrate-binding protein
MRRRKFITLLGGAALWPQTVHAQQAANPVIGFLHSGSPRPYAERMAAFHQGLAQTGFVDGRNVNIEYRWAEGHFDRLPAMAGDLVRRNVSIIVAGGGVETAPIAKAATSKIPIVFILGVDPVAMGLVKSLARPEGNITGVSFLTAALGPKRFGLLKELVPKAKSIGILRNPKNPWTEAQIKELTDIAAARGVQVRVINASNAQELATLEIPTATDALIVAPDPLFTSERAKIVRQAMQRALPAIYPSREYPEAGGLMSYGTDIRDQYRQAGVYTGRVLRGAKPADLPILQPVKFELVINMKAAKVLGVSVSNAMQLLADEVIE